jgi:hypothetical protein
MKNKNTLIPEAFINPVTSTAVARIEQTPNFIMLSMKTKIAEHEIVNTIISSVGNTCNLLTGTLLGVDDRYLAQ